MHDLRITGEQGFDDPFGRCGCGATGLAQLSGETLRVRSMEAHVAG